MADRYDDERPWGRYEDDDRYPRESERGESWGEGRRYRGEGAYGGWGPGRARARGDRGFFDRAGDEVRSWFGDEEAQRRRMRDEGRHGEYGYGGRGGERRGGGWRGDEERAWARQWGYVEPERRGEGRERRWSPERGGDWWSGSWDEPRDWSRERPGRGGGGGAGQPEGYGGWSPGRGSGSLSRTWTWIEAEVIGPFTGRGPRGYERSDERIREDVCERLLQHGAIDASEMDVRVSQGDVTLEGSVDSREAKRMAEDVAESVSGVRNVHNQLRVTGLHGGGAGRTTESGSMQAGRESQPPRHRAA
jgi:osmotically-inducible protein OsmY